MNSTVKNSINANDTLPGDISSLIFVIEELKNTVEKQGDTIKKQQHTIELLRKALFGPRSERIVDTDERQGVFDFILDEVGTMAGSPESDTALEDTDDKTSDVLSKRRKKRSSLQDLVPEDLPKEEVVIDLPEDKKTATNGTPLKQIGEERVEKLAYKPGFWFLKVFVYPKYADPSNALSGVKKAPAPDFAIPGGIFDESFLTWIACDKCSIPFHRIANLFPLPSQLP